MTDNMRINTEKDIEDGMLRYVNASLARSYCEVVVEQSNYIGKDDKKTKGLFQNEGVMYFIPGSTWTDFMQGVLTQGKYQDVILARSMKSFDLMGNGEGILSEKVFFTDSRKSCIVVDGKCAVAYQCTNGRWNLYSPEKGIDFPWIQALARKYRLGKLSNLPRLSWYMKEGYRYRDQMKMLSLYTKAAGCELKQFDYLESPFLKVEEVGRPTNYELILDVWWNLGEDARAQRICAKIIHMSSLAKGDRNLKFPYTIVHNEVSEIELLPIQKELTHNSLGEENPYTTHYEFDGEPQYKGENLWITKSGKPWLKMDGMFVPVDRNAITYICEKNPDHLAVNEYLIWKQMEELK